jgi:TonB family protein
MPAHVRLPYRARVSASTAALLVSVAAHAAAAVVLLPGEPSTVDRPSRAPITVHFVAVDRHADVGLPPTALGPAGDAKLPPATPNQFVAKGPDGKRTPKSRSVRQPSAEPVPIAAAAAPSLVRVASADVGGATIVGEAPRLIRTSVGEPHYTSDARRASYHGLIVVDVIVDPDGRVRAAALRNPTGLLLDHEVLSAARAARYVPARALDGRPLAAPAELKFQFTR